MATELRIRDSGGVAGYRKVPLTGTEMAVAYPEFEWVSDQDYNVKADAKG
jgi:hypothetical protein